MIPDFIPWILEEITDGLVERLARYHISVWFDAHVVPCSGTTFDSKLHLNRIEMAVLGRCIPDYTLPEGSGALTDGLEHGAKLVFLNTGANSLALTRVDQRIAADGGDT